MRLIGFEDAEVGLMGIEQQEIFCTQIELIQKLTTHFASQSSNFYKIFGNLELLGNPFSFASKIKTGLTDLVERPSEGLMQGPIELGVGIIKGTGSLVKNTI